MVYSIERFMFEGGWVASLSFLVPLLCVLGLELAVVDLNPVYTRH